MAIKLTEEQQFNAARDVTLAMIARFNPAGKIPMTAWGWAAGQMFVNALAAVHRNESDKDEGARDDED